MRPFYPFGCRGAVVAGLWARGGAVDAGEQPVFRGEPVSAPTIQPEQRGDGLVVTGLTPAEAEELVRGLSR